MGESLSDWAVVPESAKQIGIERFGAHDLRRICAKLCRKAGGDLEQIKFLLGHSSIQTTKRYLDRSRRSPLRSTTVWNSEAVYLAFALGKHISYMLSGQSQFRGLLSQT